MFYKRWNLEARQTIGAYFTQVISELDREQCSKLNSQPEFPSKQFIASMVHSQNLVR